MQQPHEFPLSDAVLLPGVIRQETPAEGKMSREFMGFLIAGGLAAGCNVGSRWVFSRLLPYPAAITLAYLVGMAVAFVVMRNLVFRPSSGLSKSTEFKRFTLVNLIGLAQTMLMSLAIARWLAPALGLDRHAEEIGHTIGVAVPIFTSFVGHRRYSFSKTAGSRA
jgi:putative flippase GtrA